jgi:uracil-DNA glycosylase family 4
MNQMTFELERLNADVIQCNRCERLRTYCEHVANVKRRAYRDQAYWGKPVPGWGDPQAALMIIGLAPGAHGSNRTGRMFTGDRAGDFLYSALYRKGLCNQPISISRQDGLTLQGVYITAVGRCAPPANKPLPNELNQCRPYLMTELKILESVKVILVLGRIAYDGTLKAFEELGETVRKGSDGFAHGAVRQVGSYTMVASYHVSQQNTQTGRLTAPMFDAILQTCLGFF